MAPKRSKKKTSDAVLEAELTLEELRNARRSTTLNCYPLGTKIVRGDDAGKSSRVPISAVPLRSVGPSEEVSTSGGAGDVAPEPPLTSRDQPWITDKNDGLQQVVPNLGWLERAVAKKYAAAAEIIYGIEESDGYWVRLPRDNEYIIEPPMNDGHTYIGLYVRQLEYGLRFPLAFTPSSLLYSTCTMSAWLNYAVEYKENGVVHLDLYVLWV